MEYQPYTRDGAQRHGGGRIQEREITSKVVHRSVGVTTLTPVERSAGSGPAEIAAKRGLSGYNGGVDLESI
jgi:hypothetical protein